MGHKEYVMTKIAIVYHSGYGHTKVQANAVRDGAAQVDGTEVQLIAVDELAIGDDGVEGPGWQHLDEADAIAFGSPTYMAGPSAQFKAFMDATSARWAGQAWANKLASGFTNSAGYNGDKLNTLEAFTLFAMQHSMVWIGLGLMPGNITAEGSPEDLNRLAGFLGAMAQSNADVGPDIAPAGSDLRTAAHLGRRVAEAAARWNAGELVSAGAGAGAGAAS
jgi:NAD(P)H dehydrogenase (quinone)